MKRIIVIITAALLAVSCNKQDKIQLAQLQDDLVELQQSADGIQVPSAIDAVPDEDEDYSFVFDKEIYGVDAAGSVTVGYTLPEDSQIEVIVGDGWSASVNQNGATGTVTISAPDPAKYCDVLLTATSASGRQTASKLPLLIRDPYSDATRPVMEAMGYYSFKPWNANLENYQKLADAGITMVTVETDEEDYLQQMALARAVGIKVLAVIGWATEGWYESMSPESLARLEQLIESMKNRPELFGYHIWDEPSVNHIFELMAIEDKMTQLDPDHPVYVNLRPNGSSEGMGASTYAEYVEVFASMMHLKQLSFDMYPALANGWVQTDWHYCLEIVSDAARRYNKPFWAFAATCWIDLEQVLIDRAKPTVENVQLQVYTDLAYGAQAIQYFTIQDYGGTDFAPIMRDGTWTEAYDILKTVNLRMQKRAYIFKDSKVAKVRQSGEWAPFEASLAYNDLPPEINSLNVSHSGTISFIENNGNEYVAVVNNYPCFDQILSIDFNTPVYLIGSEGQFELLEPGMTHYALKSGEMLVFKYR